MVSQRMGDNSISISGAQPFMNQGSTSDTSAACWLRPGSAARMLACQRQVTSAYASEGAPTLCSSAKSRPLTRWVCATSPPRYLLSSYDSLPRRSPCRPRGRGARGRRWGVQGGACGAGGSERWAQGGGPLASCSGGWQEDAAAGSSAPSSDTWRLVLQAAAANWHGPACQAQPSPAPLLSPAPPAGPPGHPARPRIRQPHRCAAQQRGPCAAARWRQQRSTKSLV
jgi:hypothetical protein